MQDFLETTNSLREMSTTTSIADSLARDGIYCIQDAELGSCISDMDRDGFQVLSKLEPGWEFCKRNVLNNEVGLSHCRMQATSSK